MIAFCGIICTSCSAFLATQKDDDNERKKVAAQWSKMYKSDIKPDDINCVGCLEESEILFNHCKICEIRKCGMEKDVDNCAYCDEYACDKVKQFHEHNPNLKKTLDDIKLNVDK